jgi:hypothetical protein
VFVGVLGTQTNNQVIWQVIWSISQPNGPSLLAGEVFFQSLHLELPGFLAWEAMNSGASRCGLALSNR